MTVLRLSNYFPLTKYFYTINWNLLKKKKLYLLQINRKINKWKLNYNNISLIHPDPVLHLGSKFINITATITITVSRRKKISAIVTCFWLSRWWKVRGECLIYFIFLLHAITCTFSNFYFGSRLSVKNDSTNYSNVLMERRNKFISDILKVELFKFRTFSHGSKSNSHVASICVAIIR